MTKKLYFRPILVKATATLQAVTAAYQTTGIGNLP